MSSNNSCTGTCAEHSGMVEAVSVFKNMHRETKRTQSKLDTELKGLSGKVMSIQGRLQAFTYIFGSLLVLLCSISTYSFFELSEFKKDHYIEIRSITAYNSEIAKSIAVIEQKLISMNEKLDELAEHSHTFTK